MFEPGQRVRLDERFRNGTFDPVGTVVGFHEGDMRVRWDSGLETTLAPSSLAPATPPAENA